jgi:hypothetical protein
MTAPPIVGPPFGFGSYEGESVLPPAQPLPGQNALPPLTRTLEIPLPDVYPTIDATQFNTQGQKATSVIEGPLVIPGSAIVVPANNWIRISSLNLQIDNMLLTTNVVFSLRVNQQAQGGFTNLPIFPRVAPFVGQEFDVFLRFTGPATIDVVYSNNDGGSYTLGAAVSGWFWPTASDQRVKTRGI